MKLTEMGPRLVLIVVKNLLAATTVIYGFLAAGFFLSRWQVMWPRSPIGLFYVGLFFIFSYGMFFLRRWSHLLFRTIYISLFFLALGWDLFYARGSFHLWAWLAERWGQLALFVCLDVYFEFHRDHFTPAFGTKAAAVSDSAGDEVLS